jgi:hypothetical protein
LLDGGNLTLFQDEIMLRWILAFLMTGPVWGYSLTQDFINGFYWATLPVQFVIVESDPSRKALLTQFVNSAMKQWEDETGFSLWDLGTGSSSNIIRWSTNFGAETRMDPSSVLAVAIRYTSGPYFARSEIIINGSHSAFNSPYSAINNMNLGTTLVHELGHTIGLDHSENMQAIMAPNLQYPFNGLHNDDLNGMREAVTTTETRQRERYVSPLAGARSEKSAQGLSCASTTAASSTGSGLVSTLVGVLIPLIKKLSFVVKSLLRYVRNLII